MFFEIPIFAGLGILSGFLAGFFGMGGGTVLVPILMLLGLDIKAAIGISVMQMLFTSIFGSYINFKKGLLKIDKGITIGVGGFFGAILSGYIVDVVHSSILEIAFLLLILFAIYRFFALDTEIKERREDSSKLKLLILGFFTGITAISLGVGGALILSPILVGYMGYSIKKAISMSLFFVIFSSFSGFASMAYYEHIDYFLGGVVGVFSLFGVYVGVVLAQKVNPQRHRRYIILLYFVVLAIFLERVVVENLL